jgi:hypothetical protein
LRIFAAGTSQIFSAHSGLYCFMCATSLPNAVSASMPACVQHSSSAPTSTAFATHRRPSSSGTASGVSNGTAASRFVSHSSGLRLSGSRR